MKEDIKKILIEIIAELHTLPNSFPLRESEEYDLGFQEGIRQARHILKDYILNNETMM